MNDHCSQILPSDKNFLSPVSNSWLPIRLVGERAKNKLEFENLGDIKDASDGHYQG